MCADCAILWRWPRGKAFPEPLEYLRLTQPTLSRQLMDLERELGKRLLIRGRRKATLTEDGSLLRKRAGKIAALVDKAESFFPLPCG